jgi:hypothetical protein
MSSKHITCLFLNIMMIIIIIIIIYSSSFRKDIAKPPWLLPSNRIEPILNMIWSNFVWFDIYNTCTLEYVFYWRHLQQSWCKHFIFITILSKKPNHKYIRVSCFILERKKWFLYTTSRLLLDQINKWSHRENHMQMLFATCLFSVDLFYKILFIYPIK